MNTASMSTGPVESPCVSMQEALGQSDAFLLFQERLSRVAPINRSVLLIGERGSGKELAAGRLHYLSHRWQGPLIALNCSALPATLIESELFGYEKGAFTGATVQRKGRFETASGGTLFLDEIGTIPLEAQEKILRVVEYGTFERVGGTQSIEVDVRIVAATNADLPALAAQGRFKQDLLDRLSFEVLMVPPLRVRREDILFLADHFARRMAFELGRSELPTFGATAQLALLDHPWPGNVRELKNVVERAVYRNDSALIKQIDFDPFRSPYAAQPPTATQSTPAASGPTPAVTRAEPEEENYHAALQRFKLDFMRRALKHCRYNQKKAAARMGLTYHQFRGLYRNLKDAL